MDTDLIMNDQCNENIFPNFLHTIFSEQTMKISELPTNARHSKQQCFDCAEEAELFSPGDTFSPNMERHIVCLHHIIESTVYGGHING